jgi:SAM-dependent methyltransferase
MGRAQARTLRSLAIRVRRWGAYEARHAAVVGGLRPYRPHVFEPGQWEAWFSDPQGPFARRLGELAERHKFGILVEYLRSVLTPESDILDVGCGTGLLRANAEGLPFRSWCGIDPTPSAIRQAKALEDERTRFVLGDPITVELEQADVVACVEVLYMVPDYRRLAARLVELCRDPGYVIVSLYRHPGDTVIWRELERNLDVADTVEIRAPGYANAPRGWRLALYAKRRSPRHDTVGGTSI